MVKKLIVLMLALTMVFGVCACTEEKNEVAETVSEEIEEVKAETPEEQPETAVEEEKEEETVIPESQNEEEPVQNEVQTLEEPPVEEPVQEEQAPAAKPEAKTASKETASKYIGQSTSALVGAIGEPNSKTYASSCIGDGEDGEWYYDGFTVYTYRENGSERVEDVF